MKTVRITQRRVVYSLLALTALFWVVCAVGCAGSGATVTPPSTRIDQSGREVDATVRSERRIVVDLVPPNTPMPPLPDPPARGAKKGGAR